MISHNGGFYKVGDEIFASKIEAIYKANQTKKDISWNFHNDVFNSIDWTTEPEETLDSFYKTRALQIRNKYDYLVLFCSGGADSTNMLYSFLKNGIHVDEVVAGAPISGLNRWQDNLSDKSAENTISETRLTQLPLMKEISEKWPAVKITIHDYFIDMLNFKEDEWLWKSDDYIHPTFAARYKLDRDEYNHLKKIADSGKSIGFVYGLDKPFIIEDNGMYFSVIRDQIVCNAFNALEHPMSYVEMFYYTPNLPLMMVKQAHCVAKFISMPHNFYIYDNILFDSKRVIGGDPTKTGDLRDYSKTAHSGIYERGIVPLIYPSLDKQVFQANKPRSVFFGEHDSWFEKLHQDTRAFQLVKSDFNNFISSVDSKFFRTNNDVITQFISLSRKYSIGSVLNFAPRNIITK